MNTYIAGPLQAPRVYRRGQHHIICSFIMNMKSSSNVQFTVSVIITIYERPMLVSIAAITCMQ